MIGYYNNPKRLSLAETDDHRIHGTWDFKWPQDTTIKVAFKEPSADTKSAVADLVPSDELGLTSVERREVDAHDGFQRLIRIVECLANRWLVQSPNIRFRFVHHTAKPPVSKPSGARPGSEGAAPEDYYDVLVSFEPLPLEVRVLQPRPGLDLIPSRKVFLPGSELGRYAQRIDFGVPTIYLGPRKYFEEGAVNRIKRYFSSLEFYHWVIHEFGHVLGLPHEHQNPHAHARVQLKSEAKVVSLLREALGYQGKEDEERDITVDEVKEEIFKPWPVLRDSNQGILYSDFRSYAPDERVDDESSVMFHVFWKRLVNGGSDKAAPTYHVRPTEKDAEQVLRMYPRDDGRAAVVAQR